MQCTRRKRCRYGVIVSCNVPRSGSRDCEGAGRRAAQCAHRCSHSSAEGVTLRQLHAYSYPVQCSRTGAESSCAAAASSGMPRAGCPETSSDARSQTVCSSTSHKLRVSNCDYLTCLVCSFSTASRFCSFASPVCCDLRTVSDVFVCLLSHISEQQIGNYRNIQNI